MNEGQARLVARLTNALDAEEMNEESHPLRIIVQGKAGTGKSFLIAICRIKRYQNPRPVIVCAPTGLAAPGAGGTTMDNEFSIAFGETSLTHVETLEDQKKQAVVSQLRLCEVLILDESSMAGLTKLMQMNNALQVTKESNESFGGVHCIFFGDWNQIPPVMDYNLLQNDQLFDSFDVMELYEGMRQKSDPDFQTALDNFADGKCTGTDVELFQSLEDKEDIDSWATINDITAIFNLNKTLDASNEKVITQFPDAIQYKASYSAHMPADPPSTGPNQTPVSLKITTGRRVMVLEVPQLYPIKRPGPSTKYLSSHPSHVL